MVMERGARARAAIETVDADTAPEAAVVSFSHAAAPAILESSRPGEPYGRFSVFACDPFKVIEVRGGAAPLDAFAERLRAYPRMEPPPELPFAGGWIGALTYEAGLTLEGVAPAASDDLRLPFLRFGLYDAAALFDHAKAQWYAAAVDWPEPIRDRRPSVRTRLDELKRRLAAPVPDCFEEPPAPTASDPAPNLSRAAYLERVTRAKEHIAAGDIYQVNLTQRFAARTSLSPTDLYRRLRSSTPSSHAAFLQWGDTVILSASPELFLSLRGDRVVTRPIKGTRPRTGDAVCDAAAAVDLAESGKERAELNMIVDLLRNDLGRVCAYGSVRVADAGSIEHHPTVIHRTATIEGRLEQGRGWLDLLRACFPGGSVTGAPKIRAMQIISELEPTVRGVYCGSIGWIGLDGSMSLNVAIRTMVQRRDVVHVHAGGAIVADSEPVAEYEETLTKAAGMFRALGCRSRPESAARPLLTTL
jgi:para-aminobenzoate synthetase component 1